MVLVKVCGITNLQDALDAIDAGADYLGFNFYPESPRFIEPSLAAEIFENIPPNIPKVGVFVNEAIDKVVDLAVELELDYLQFHGDETPEMLNNLGRSWFRALRLANSEDLQQIPLYDCEWILLDAVSNKGYGGTGELANWDLVKQAKKFGKKIILAGGLNPENVSSAVIKTDPFMVDVASGVESAPGKKSQELMQKFVERAKALHLKVIK